MSVWESLGTPEKLPHTGRDFRIFVAKNPAGVDTLSQLQVSRVGTPCQALGQACILPGTPEKFMASFREQPECLMECQRG